MSTTWFSAFNGDDDDVANFISASSLRRQARRHVEEQTFSFREERRRVDLGRVSLRDELGSSSLLASRVSVGRDSRRIDFSTPVFSSPFTARDFAFPSSPPSIRRGRRVEVDEVSSTASSSNNKPQQHETTEISDIRQSLRDLKDENQKLQAVVNDVMEVNKRWQRHHSDRELYVQKLLNTITELQQKINNSSAVQPTIIKERVGGVTASTERLAQLEAENAQLRLDLESARRKVQALEQEHKEHAELLGIQVRSYKDDWEAERREKEQLARERQAAEERARDLQAQLAAVQKKLQEKNALNSPPSHRCCPLHLCESSSAPVVSSSHCCGAANKSTTFRTSVHLPCGPTVAQVKLREPRLPENIALDNNSSSGLHSRVSSFDSNISLSRPESPSIKSETTSSIIKTSPITIGFEDGLASVQSFTFNPTTTTTTATGTGTGIDRDSKVSVFEIAAPPVSPPSIFKEWQNEPYLPEEGILTQTRENVTCPRCGKIFPPEKHLKFLDHFEVCQEYGSLSRTTSNCDL